MLLLNSEADINAADARGRTPIDLASASEIIWPHFAALGCKRTSKSSLKQKQVFSKSQMGSISSESSTKSEFSFHRIKFVCLA